MGVRKYRAATPRAAIFGLKGERLSIEEQEFFKETNPLGFILFARNCKEPGQIRKLTDELRALAGREDTPILIDQEGGRVARLGPPYWRKVPPAWTFVELAKKNLAKGKKAAFLNARLMAEELSALGINVDCAPTADLKIPGSHTIIGDRAHGDTPEMVASLAGEVCRGLMEGGVLPVLKHIPGHGRAKVDSHESLPVVDASLEELQKTDFLPFKKLAHTPWGMTAHITYTAIDPRWPATLSPKVIRLIRDEIGFDGLLVTDDLSMKALKGSFEERTTRSLDAGCDVVLHCNGEMKEMIAVASAVPALSTHAHRRFMASAKYFHSGTPLAESQDEQALNQLLA